MDAAFFMLVPRQLPLLDLLLKSHGEQIEIPKKMDCVLENILFTSFSMKFILFHFR